jgi:hypothetical protein
MQWWRGRVQEAKTDNGGFGTVEEFLPQLISSCGERNAITAARNGIMQLKQTCSVMKYANQSGASAAELSESESCGGWIAYLFPTRLKRSLRAIILGKFQNDWIWMQIRDLAIRHDDVAFEATRAAESNSENKPVEMELGMVHTSRRGRSAISHPRGRNFGEAGISKQDGKFECWHCGKCGHKRSECLELK